MAANQAQDRSWKPVSRRDFLKLGTAAAGVGAAAWAGSQLGQGPSLPAGAEGIQTLKESLVRTTCALCPSGCGLEVRVTGGRAVKVEGNPLHPLNQGVCCLKGQASMEVLYSPERIQHPWRQLGPRGSGDWEEISWDEAFGLVVEKLRGLRSSGKAHSLALVHGELRGQMRSLVNRFMQVFGSPNVISTASLGEQAVRLAAYLTQGLNTLPAYDINNASYVITFGGNFLESGRNLIGNLSALAFMRRGRPQRGKLVAVHPRLSLTGVKADEWIPIRPGTYGALALGMANVIINSKLYNEAFVRDFCYGFDDFSDEAGETHLGFKRLVTEQYTLERVSAVTGVASETIARLAGEFATNLPAVAVLPTEPGELGSGNGLYAAMAIHALNALVGSIDAKGGVMVQRFPPAALWPEAALDETARQGLAFPRLDGAGKNQLLLAPTAYQEFPERILADDPYPLEALFLLNANPVYELPQGGRTAQALLKVPFVVSFAPILDESAAHADLILPASTFLEVWGDDYMEGCGYAGVSLRRPVVAPVHDTRDPGDVLLELAARLGEPLSPALPWRNYLELVKHRLSAIDLDWETLESNGSWSEMIYFNAEPGSPAWSRVVGRDRLFAPKDGRFDFYSRELFASLEHPADLDCLPHFELPAPQTVSPEAAEYPFLLITQSLITQAQTWQGIIPSLQEVYGLQASTKWSSWLEMNPVAAQALGLAENDLVWVESAAGKIQVPVRFYQGLWPNVVFMPAGLGHGTRVRWGRYAAEKQMVGVNPQELVDVQSETLSGQAVFNPTRVRVYRA